MSDDPQCQKRALDKECHNPCASLFTEYEACGKRIAGKPKGDHNCEPQAFDYWKCVDKCTARSLFSKLK